MLRYLLLIGLTLLSSCSQQKSDRSVARFNLYTEPPSLDSRLACDITSLNMLTSLFDGLTRIAPDETPQLAEAESIEISPDGLLYRITLRETYWSNGERVTVEDYVDTWKEILDPLYPSPFAYKLFVIKNGRRAKAGKCSIDDVGLRVIDERQFEITLENPTPFFLELLAYPTFFPTHRKLEGEWSGEAATYLSNGPFQLEKWVHNGEIVMTPNPYYWDREHVKLDRIEFCMVEDATTEFYMFEQGELDWAGSPLSNIPPEIAPALEEKGRLITYSTTGVYFLEFNTNRFPLNNTKIRKALNLAINREELIKHVYQIDHLVAYSFVPPMCALDAPLVCFQDASFALAKQLFEEGMAEEGLTLKSFPTLTLSYNTSKLHHKILQAIQQQWNTVFGIHVGLEAADWKAYLSDISKQNFDICRMGWVGEYFDPITCLLLFKERGGDGVNYTGWYEEEYSELIECAEQEIDPTKRKALLVKAERLLMDAMPVAPICHINFAYVKNPKLQGVYASPIGVLDLKEAYLAK